jgi:hypothetical protein
MRMTILSGMGLAAGLAACASEPQGPPEYLGAQVKQVSDDVFAVGITGRNIDEYAFARCVAAGYAATRKIDSIGELPGTPLHTRYTKVDGKRMTQSYGVRQFTTAEKSDPEPERTIDVKETLAKCEADGIPTGLEKKGDGGTTG